MKTSLWKIFCLLVLLFAVNIPTSIAIANSLPPPYRVWFRFVNEQEKPVEVTGLQIAGCADETCQSPEYLIGFGKCTGTGCFAGLPKLSDPWKLACAGNQCLFEVQYPYSQELPAYLQMYLSTDDASGKSNKLLTPDCPYCNTGFKVVLSQSGATAGIDGDFDYLKEGTLSNPYITFLFTIAVEVIVSIPFYLFWKRKSPVSWKKLAWSVVLANVISYPVAWVTIASYGRFQEDSFRKFGLIALGVSIVITAVSLAIAANREKIKKWMVIVGILLVPVCAAVVLVLMFISAYGNREIYAQGLSPAAVIVAAEVFAVTCETLYIRNLRKEELTIKQVFVLCLVMNAISAGLGFLIF